MAYRNICLSILILCWSLCSLNSAMEISSKDSWFNPKCEIWFIRFIKAQRIPPRPRNSVTPKEQELPQHKLDNSTSVRPEIPGISKAVSFLPKCADVEFQSLLDQSYSTYRPTRLASHFFSTFSTTSQLLSWIFILDYIPLKMFIYSCLCSSKLRLV